MSVGYTDEELKFLVRNRSQRLMATIRRLQAERSEAMRVAKVLARGVDKCDSEDVDRYVSACSQALSYPEES